MLLTWQALRAQPLLAPDAATLAALGALVGVVGAARVAAVATARRHADLAVAVSWPARRPGHRIAGDRRDGWLRPRPAWTAAAPSDARERKIPHLVTAPVLVLTILLGPLGMLAHLVVRAVRQRSGAAVAS